MIICARLVVLTVIVCHARITSSHTEDFDAGAYKMTVYAKHPLNGLQKRAVQSTAILFRRVLQNAALLSSRNKYRVYLKSGSYEEALLDFYRLEPTQVMKSETIRFGNVGNYRVSVGENINGRDIAKAEMVIWKAGDGVQSLRTSIIYSENYLPDVPL